MNIINPRLPSGWTLFCDDVRYETSGKISLIGVYSSVMYIQSLPVVLPQLWASVHILQSPDETRPLTFRILFEVDGETRMLHEAHIEPQVSPDLRQTGDIQLVQLTFQVQLPHFQILETGCLKVRAYRDDDEIRLGTLEIQTAPE